jgi:5-methylcytosine-specific restriction endonuclease McrA
MLKPRKPIRKQSKKEDLGKVADALITALVFDRDENKCVRCGGTNALAPSHILSRGKYKRMRWVPENILTLCSGCHIFWWHKEPIAAARWLEQKFPGLADKLYLADAVAVKVDVKNLVAGLRAISRV